VGKKLSKELTAFFAKDEVESIAKETDFVQRTSAKLNGSTFVDSLLFTGFNHKDLSLEALSTQLDHEYHVEISKQGVDQRFNENSVAFMKSLLEQLLPKVLSEVPVISFLEDYRSVRIKDSTSFQLPENMEEKYSGSGGDASKAVIRIQFEYDYRSGKVYDLSLHAFNDQDAKDAQLTVSNIEKNDLIIRDLGYVVIKVLLFIANMEAWYLNRFNFSSTAYEKIGDVYQEIDFGKIQKYMNKNQVDSLEKEVYIGKKKSLKTRLIIERLPEKKVEVRLRKAKEQARKKGRQLTDKYKAHIGLNVYITNIDAEKLPVKNVQILYKLRWQIELVFKIWKSIGEIHKVKKMKLHRFETLLFAKLIWIIINWAIMWDISQHIWQEKQMFISPIKIFKTLKTNSKELQIALNNSANSMLDFINEIYRLSPKHHQLEKKKNQLSSIEIIMLLAM